MELKNEKIIANSILLHLRLDMKTDFCHIAKK
jgi:hypothetical protein